jgi:hypothetical protein
MASMAIALPCLPGGADKLREVAAECTGARKDEFADFHARVNLTREQWFVQKTPQGEMLILVLDGDPPGALAKLAASEAPFDNWFLDQVKQVHGVDLREPLPGPPPELVFEG